MSTTQCAAVTTHSGVMSDPPQNCFHFPELVLYVNMACQGHVLGVASVPPTIRTLDFLPHSGTSRRRTVQQVRLYTLSEAWEGPEKCVCVCVCVCVCMCMCVCVCIYIHTYIHTYMHAYIHTFAKTRGIKPKIENLAIMTQVSGSLKVASTT